MKKTLKKFVAAFLTAMIAVCFSVPMTASAAPGTLGDESPYLYCEFTDENGDAADGNHLTAGTYQVNIVLSGMESLSVFQFTADYDPAVLTAVDVTSTYEDTDASFSCGGIKNQDGTLVAAFASANDDCTAVDAEGTVIATLSVTVDTPSSTDFQGPFLFNTDPDLTFAEADYGDGIEAAYVLDVNAETETAIPQMTADESPENELEPTITVSGRVLIALDAAGTASDFGLRGVKIYAYDNDNNVIVETVSNSEGDKSTWGDFSLEVPAGTTNFMVGDPVKGLDTIANRSFIIAGDTDVTGANVSVIMCDYNDDTFINATDKAVFNSSMKGNYSIYADFNNDGFVNATDKAVFNSIMKNSTKGIEYSEGLVYE